MQELPCVAFRDRATAAVIPVKINIIEMRDHLLPFLIALRVAGLVLPTAGFAADVKALAAAVDSHYNHLRSLQAEFTEIYRGAGMDRTESGTLWLKKPGKMRWEYRSPKDKLFVSNGKDAWFYVPADRQARKEDAKKLEDVRSPLAFLLGKAKLEKELQGLSLAPDVEPWQPGDLVLRGVPQALADRVSEILLEITARPPDCTDCPPGSGWGGDGIPVWRDEGKRGRSRMERFQFKPPAGTETLEGGLEP